MSVFSKIDKKNSNIFIQKSSGKLSILKLYNLSICYEVNLEIIKKLYPFNDY